jgi:uncharacterized protein (TIGR02246 family)
MRTMRMIPALMLASLAFAAHAQTDNAVQNLANRWATAYNQHDREALGALYTEDAHLMMHGAPTIRGREAIQEFWAEDMQAGNPLTVLTVTHAVEGSDMILVHGNYQVIDRDTGELVGFGRFAHIWNRSDGEEWRLDRDLWNQPFDPYPL